MERLRFDIHTDYLNRRRLHLIQAASGRG
jgi:hypothetical protein